MVMIGVVIYHQMETIQYGKIVQLVNHWKKMDFISVTAILQKEL